jgi:hypothetical protein
MYLIGVDYHPSFQTIAFFVEETGECGEQELDHRDGQAEKFYRDLKQRGIRVRVGMEATGYSRWFERLLAELGFELWIGDPAEIKAKRVKKQKFDREDARLLLRLMRENNFPQIWVPGPENRDLRQLLWHRHRLVQMRTRMMNQLHALAMNEGYRWKKKLFSKQGRAQFEKLAWQSLGRYVCRKLLYLCASVPELFHEKLPPLAVRYHHYVLEAPCFRTFPLSSLIDLVVLYGFRRRKLLQRAHDFGHSLTHALQYFLRWTRNTCIYRRHHLLQLVCSPEVSLRARSQSGCNLG